MKLTFRNATDEQLNEYFEDKVEHLVKYIKRFWNWKGLKPKGYKKYLENYQDYQDMDTCKDHEKFTGIHDDHTMSNSFPVNCSLPHVAYDDTNQGRDPLKVLIQSCVSWGARLGEETEKRKLKARMEHFKESQGRMLKLSNQMLKDKFPGITDEDLIAYTWIFNEAMALNR